MLDGFQKEVFKGALTGGEEVSHDVYTKGEGPTVLIIQELPGIGKSTLDLADVFVAKGFSVALPHLFGPLGRTTPLNMLRVFCMRREFHLFLKNGSSPIVGWLRALCQTLRERSDHDGVAVIGMCLTGNFALSLIADDAVLASVASQPAMPFLAQGALHMSEDDLAASRERLDQVGPMMALRFEKDWMCTARKFEAIDQHLNQDGHRVRQRVLPGKGHSVLTEDFVDKEGHPTREALDDVLRYFRRSFKMDGD